jgi:hypothetical protein
MSEVAPFIRCVDYWPGQIPPDKLKAYKLMLQSGIILKQHVIYNRETHSTTVEYLSTIPHEWVKEELKKAVNDDCP